MKKQHSGENHSANEINSQPECTASVKDSHGYEGIAGDGFLDVDKRTEINTVFEPGGVVPNVSELFQRESEININDGCQNVPVEIAEVVIQTDNEIPGSLAREIRRRAKNSRKFSDNISDDVYEADEENSETNSVDDMRELESDWSEKCTISDLFPDDLPDTNLTSYQLMEAVNDDTSTIGYEWSDSGDISDVEIITSKEGEREDNDIIDSMGQSVSRSGESNTPRTCEVRDESDDLSRNFPFERINILQCYELTRRCSHLPFT